GTSMNSAFMSLIGESEVILQKTINSPEHYHRNEETLIARGRWMLESGLFTYGFSRWPVWDVKIPSDVFTFTCLRDPFKRLFSRYRQLKGYNTGVHQEKFRSDRPDHAKLMNDDFYAFVKDAPRQEVNHSLYLFSETCDVKIAFDSANKLDYFYFVENIEEGFKEMAKASQLPLKYHWKNKSGYKEPLSESVKAEVIRDYLQEEYEFFELMKEEYARRHGKVPF
ncbi:MAG: sulfotransferase family 2 domain-containing protein, partial [Bacteroidota bacterium]